MSTAAVDSFAVVDLLSEFLAYMYDFQSINSIESECRTNVQLCYAHFKKLLPDLRVEAFIVAGINPSDHVFELIGGHVALVLDDTIIDPSYEAAKLLEKKYFTTVDQFLQFLQQINKNMDENQLTNAYTKFVTVAAGINDETSEIFNKAYYAEQEAYIMRQIKNKKTFKIVSAQIESMYEYQKKNDISTECIANVKYLMDCLEPCKKSGTNIKAIAAIVIGIDPLDANGAFLVVGGHVILVIDGELIEPSYYVDSLEKKKYFLSDTEYKEFLAEHKIDEQIDHAEVPVQYAKFVAIAERLNSETFTNHDQAFIEYYVAQAEYVEAEMVKKGVF